MASPDTSPAPESASASRRYIAETRAFFARRAATWDTKFGDDMPAYAQRSPSGHQSRGRGRRRRLWHRAGAAALRQAVGPEGAVIAVDLTPEMLAAARPKATAARAALIIADARRAALRRRVGRRAVRRRPGQPPARHRSGARRTRPRHPPRWPARPVPPLRPRGARRPAGRRCLATSRCLSVRSAGRRWPRAGS